MQQPALPAHKPKESQLPVLSVLFWSANVHFLAGASIILRSSSLGKIQYHQRLYFSGPPVVAITVLHFPSAAVAAIGVGRINHHTYGQTEPGNRPVGVGLILNLSIACISSNTCLTSLVIRQHVHGIVILQLFIVYSLQKKETILMSITRPNTYSR